MSQFKIEEYLIEEQLGKNTHFREVSDFYCGNEGLDSFLKTEAFNYNKDGQGSTYIIKSIENNDIIGYYTLKANAIQIQEKNKAIKTLPAIEIARLAINNNYKNQKFGTIIFYSYILPKIIQVKSIIGVSVIMVFVVSNEIEEYKKPISYFYEKFGFKLAEKEVQKYIIDDFSEGCKLMYCSTKDLDEAFYIQTKKEEV